jgi:ribosome-associated translation inhibitor RaiA
MEITVSGHLGRVENRTRVYAEYRVFETLRRFERDIHRVEIALRPKSEPPGGGRTACRVAVRLVTGETTVAEAIAGWPYAAIDRAVRGAAERLSAGSIAAAS